MRIGIDFDDVTAHLAEPILKFYNEKNNRNHSKDDLKEYDLWVNWGITKDEGMAIINEFHQKEQVSTTKPIENAIESISKLLSNGDKLWIITARNPLYKKNVENWISHHIGSKKINVITTRDFKKGENLKKSQICKELQIDLMIEDSGQNAIECAKEGIKVILFDNPWNQKFSHEKIIRLSGWKETIDYLSSAVSR